MTDFFIAVSSHADRFDEFVPKAQKVVDSVRWIEV
jgi:hypothetical protein